MFDVLWETEELPTAVFLHFIYHKEIQKLFKNHRLSILENIGFGCRSAVFSGAVLLSKIFFTAEKCIKQGNHRRISLTLDNYNTLR